MQRVINHLAKDYIKLKVKQRHNERDGRVEQFSRLEFAHTYAVPCWLPFVLL